MESRWFFSSPNKVQSDIYEVYVKALHASTNSNKDLDTYYEASSFKNKPIFKYKEILL